MGRRSWQVVGLVLTVMSLTVTAAEPAEIGWNGLEVRGGVILPADWDNGWTVGASADLGEIVDGLRLYPGISYSQADASDTVGFFGQPIRFEREITDLALGAEVRWFFSGGPDGWYVGGGPYLHRLEFEQAVILGNVVGTATIQTDVVGLEGVAGYSFGGRFDIQARYDTVSDFEGAQLLVGVRFGG